MTVQEIVVGNTLAAERERVITALTRLGLPADIVDLDRQTYKQYRLVKGRVGTVKGHFEEPEIVGEQALLRSDIIEQALARLPQEQAALITNSSLPESVEAVVDLKSGRPMTLFTMNLPGCDGFGLNCTAYRDGEGRILIGDEIGGMAKPMALVEAVGALHGGVEQEIAIAAGRE